MLSRSQFLASAPKAATEEVAVPELGGAVSVREMTCGARDRFEVAVAEGHRRDFRALLLVASVADEAGAPLFTAADVPALSAMPSSTLRPLVDAALRLNKVAEADVEAAAKNSESTPPADS